MSRDNGGTHGETRSSALWGTGNRGGDSRANALWGKGGRGFIAILSVLFVAAIPLAGGAVQTPKQQAPTYVDPVLLAKAHTDPKGLTKMVIRVPRTSPTRRRRLNGRRAKTSRLIKST